MATNNSANNITAATGKLLQGQGVGVASAFSTATYPSVATGTGTFMRADGTNWVASSSTIPNTNAQGDLIYGSATNVWTSLAKDTNSTRYLSNTGTTNNPAWAQIALTTGVSGILPIANGGTNASSMAATNGIVKFDGTRLINAAAAILDASSRYTNTAQPFVYAKVATGLTNQTGDGTGVTVIYNTVVAQQGSAYNSTTGVYTVPADGIYLIAAMIGWNNIGPSHQRGQINILAGSSISTQIEANPASCASSSTVYTQQGFVMTMLSTGNTISVSGFVSGGTKTVGIGGDSFGQYSSLYIAKLF